jgi:hypothetical protein
VTPLNVDLPKTVLVGVDAVNTSKEPFTVEFEDLKLIRKPTSGQAESQKEDKSDRRTPTLERP